MIMGFFATLFSFVGMILSKDIQAIPNEAEHYELGKTKYCIVLVATAVLWQCFYLGIVGVIFTADTLLSAVITAVCIPITEVLGVVFYHEKFTSEKGISLALALWGLASYSYGEYLHNKDRKKERIVLE